MITIRLIHDISVQPFMIGSYVKGMTRRRVLLLPDYIEDYVEQNNPVRFIDAFVESIDLNAIGFAHSELELGAGRPSYDPEDLLKL